MACMASVSILNVGLFSEPDVIRGRTRVAGRYTSKLWHDKDCPRIQILTVEDLLDGTERIDAPPQINPFAMAARAQKQHEQAAMS